MTVWSLSDITFNFVTVKYCFYNFFAPLGLEYISDALWLPDLCSYCVFAVVGSRSFCWALVVT